MKTEIGKPGFANLDAHFSISHSRDMIALIYSPNHIVSIDIEKIQKKVIAIKTKYLHPFDFVQEDEEIDLTIVWSAKESIYKYYHTRELYSFKEKIAVYEKNNFSLKYKLIVEGIQCSEIVNFMQIEDFIITWII